MNHAYHAYHAQWVQLQLVATSKSTCDWSCDQASIVTLMICMWLIHHTAKNVPWGVCPPSLAAQIAESSQCTSSGVAIVGIRMVYLDTLQGNEILIGLKTAGLIGPQNLRSNPFLQTMTFSDLKTTRKKSIKVKVCFKQSSSSPTAPLWAFRFRPADPSKSKSSSATMAGSECAQNVLDSWRSDLEPGPNVSKGSKSQKDCLGPYDMIQNIRTPAHSGDSPQVLQKIYTDTLHPASRTEARSTNRRKHTLWDMMQYNAIYTCIYMVPYICVRDCACICIKCMKYAYIYTLFTNIMKHSTLGTYITAHIIPHIFIARYIIPIIIPRGEIRATSRS